MARRRFRPEEIIHKLREAEVELAQGKKAPDVCKKPGVTEQTYYRWRKVYGGLKVDQAGWHEDQANTTKGNRQMFPALSLGASDCHYQEVSATDS